MLFPRQPSAPHEGPSLSAPPSSDEALSSEIAKLSSDENCVALLNREDSLAALLKPAAKALRDKSKLMLRSIVNIWVEQTRPLLGIAEMFRDMRDLEKRSQSMAAAAEEMTASIGEVARSAEIVAQDAKNVKQELSPASNKSARPFLPWKA
jgi:methyl-accepting chemotaxis protein